ncbi:hypothetical protein H5410_046467 [Solanum commersonii]|uniref:Uncharacterized protein n=1 Tax=Solanum commersonii TaxID=4109 RepID=A0A9J5XCB9_SOLCO|nr:hypothetical protein H5410_046467 [Solanum commersonii]
MKEEFRSKGSPLWYKDGTHILDSHTELNRGALSILHLVYDRGILARPSYEGISGFTDTQRSNQIGMEILNLIHITTTMYQQ